MGRSYMTPAIPQERPMGAMLFRKPAAMPFAIFNP